MIGEVVSNFDNLKRPKTWEQLEPGALVAVPNQCANYFDYDWTWGELIRVTAHPPRNSTAASPTHHAEVRISKCTAIWITRLDLLRVVPAN
jgi:hypothetical protein